jgi:hypothetical protein
MDLRKESSMRRAALLIAGVSILVGCSSSNGGAAGAGGSHAGSGGGSGSGGTAGSATTSTGGAAGAGPTSSGGVGGKTTGAGGSGATGSGGAAGSDGTRADAAVANKADGGGVVSEVGAAVDAPSTPDAAAETKPRSDGATTSKDLGGASSDGGSTTTGPCDRVGLQAAVDSYLAAIAAKDPTKMSTASSVKYMESTSAKSVDKVVELGKAGLWQTALPVKYSRSLLDVTGCEMFTEVFITEGGHPYVLGTRLKLTDGKISEIEVVVTDDGDWNFDATAYQTCAASEDWGVLPDADRSTREQLIAAGQAYFDIFSDKTVQVPWGTPCYRLEGGKGCTPQMDKSSQSCNVGIPDGVTFTKTHWVVDVDVGGVVGITLFYGASPDTHMFRLVKGKIVKVHTLTCTGDG